MYSSVHNGPQAFLSVRPKRRTSHGTLVGWEVEPGVFQLSRDGLGSQSPAPDNVTSPVGLLRLGTGHSFVCVEGGSLYLVPSQGGERSRLDDAEEVLNAAASSPYGTHVAAVSENGTLFVWSASRRRLLALLRTEGT